MIIVQIKFIYILSIYNLVIKAKFFINAENYSPVAAFKAEKILEELKPMGSDREQYPKH